MSNKLLSHLKLPTNHKLSNKDKEALDYLGNLGVMMLWQNNLSKTLGVNYENEDSLKNIIAMLAVEAGEALAHFLNSTKPWKPTEVDYDKLDEEMIDCLHFLLTYFNIRNFTDDEIVEHYRAKNLKNIERIKSES